MHAAIYARKSTEERGNEETRSIARQVADAQAFAARLGLPKIDDLHVYRDEAISGADVKNLRGRARLMADIGAGKIDTLIMADMSRFSRREGHEVVAELKQIAKKATIYFYETGQRYVFGDIGTNVSNFVMAEANADYRRKIRTKTINAMRAKAEKGHVLGSAPFGYKNVDVIVGMDAYNRPIRSHVTREIDEPKAAIVREIFDRYVKGQGFKQIAVALNREGAPTPRPRHEKNHEGVVQPIRPAAWGPSNVRSILLQPLYRGIQRWNRLNQHDDEGKKRSSVNEEADQITYFNPEWRIVSDAVADAVEARFADTERKKFGPKPGPRTKYLLSGGMLLCPTCGGRFEAMNGKYYVCSSRRHSGGTACSNPLAIRIDVMDHAVLRLLEGQVLAPAFIEQVLSLIASSASDEHRTALEAQRQALTEEIATLINLTAAMGDTSVVELAEKIKAKTAARDALDRDLAALAKPVDNEALRALLEQRAADWRTRLRSDYPDEVRYVVTQLIGPIELWHGPYDGEFGEPTDPAVKLASKANIEFEDLGLKAAVTPEGLLSGLTVQLVGCGGRI